jgi:hypothetical protein
MDADMQGAHHVPADASAQRAGHQRREQPTDSTSGQLQHDIPPCSLHTPTGSEPTSSTNPASSHAQDVQTSTQEGHLGVCEHPASPSSVAASDFSTSSISMIADRLTDAELAAAMRAVLKVRKQ